MAATTIQSIRARQVIDCKCRPMVEVDVITQGGALGRGCAPTGTSVGRHEAFVLRDGDPFEYRGLGVHKAVANVHEVLGPALVGLDVADQARLDGTMNRLDGTPDKRRLGGNAIYATSVACLQAAAAACGQPLYRYLAGEPIRTLPVPSFNVVNGGKYPGFTQAFNEFLVMPYRAKDIFEAVAMGILVFQELGPVIAGHTGKEPGVARSYGYEAPSSDPAVVLTMLQEAVDRCGFRDRVAFALDCASSEMYDPDTRTYLLGRERVSADALIDYVRGLSERFNLVFVEDLLDEDDWEHFPRAVERIPRTLILGDDLIVSNRERLERACRLKAVAGFVLKPNQVGTVTEALETYRFAREHGLVAVPSGRSGGAVNDVVMDFSVGLQVPFQKNGAPRSGERIEKLNFLMRACDLSPGSRLADLSSLVRF
ncbi:MAG: enolase [Holophaga sp.]|jgi:enolase